MQSAVKHLLLGTLCLFSLCALVGCGSMCMSTQDCEFHAFGGLRDRQDRVNGRVASLFDPAIASPGYVPEEAPLPPLEPDELGDPGGEKPGEDPLGKEEEEPWEKELRKELDEMKLPSDELGAGSRGGGEVDPGGLSEEI